MAQDRHYQCEQQVFGAVRQCVPVERATHCYHHCGTEGMATAIWGDHHWFCSLPCYKAHLLETPSYAHQMLLQALPTRARTEFKVTAPIKPAPPRAALAMFGGPLTVQEFLAVAADPAVQVTVVSDHEVSHSTIVEVQRKQSDRDGFREVFHQGSAASATDVPDTDTLFEKIARDISTTRNEKIADMQGKSMFKGMGAKRKANAKK